MQRAAKAGVSWPQRGWRASVRRRCNRPNAWRRPPSILRRPRSCAMRSRRERPVHTRRGGITPAGVAGARAGSGASVATWATPRAGQDSRPTGGAALGCKAADHVIVVGHARNGADPIRAMLLGQQPRRKARELLEVERVGALRLADGRRSGRGPARGCGCAARALHSVVVAVPRRRAASQRSPRARPRGGRASPGPWVARSPRVGAQVWLLATMMLLVRRVAVPIMVALLRPGTWEGTRGCREAR